MDRSIDGVKRRLGMEYNRLGRNETLDGLLGRVVVRRGLPHVKQGILGEERGAVMIYGWIGGYCLVGWTDVGSN